MCTLDQFIKNACEMLESKRPGLVTITDEICSVLENTFKSNKITVNGRVKSKDSLKEKIIRKNYYGKYNKDAKKLIDNLTDLIGIRINCLLSKEEEEIYNRLKQVFTKKVEGDDRFYISEEGGFEGFEINLKDVQPQKQNNGHDIYRIDARYREGEIVCYIEVQIKSSINALWGEIEHKLFYKNYEYLIDQGFYNDIMGALLNNLDAVEKQLVLVQNRLENDLDMVEEGEDILSKLLYNKYNEQLKSVACDCNLDFRYIYKLISECYNSTPGSIHNTLKVGMDTITRESNVIDENLISELSMMHINTSGPYQKRIVLIIDNEIKSHEVFWIGYIYLFNVLFKEEGAGWNYTQLLLKIADKMINKINMRNEQIEIGKEYLSIPILEVMIKYLEESKSLKIFLRDKLAHVYTIIDRFIELNQCGENIQENIRENEYLDKYLMLVLTIVNKNELILEDIDLIKVLQTEWSYKIVKEEHSDILSTLIQNEDIKQSDIRRIIKILCGDYEEVSINV